MIEAIATLYVFCLEINSYSNKNKPIFPLVDLALSGQYKFEYIW